MTQLQLPAGSGSVSGDLITARQPVFSIPNGVPAATRLLALTARIAMFVFGAAVFCWHAAAVVMFVPTSPYAGNSVTGQLIGAMTAGVAAGIGVSAALAHRDHPLVDYLRPGLSLAVAATLTLAITYTLTH